MRLSLIWLVFSSLLLTIVLAQDGGEEESATPKKVLRKYRVRRPIVVDENGNIRPVPRLRRIRVKGRPTSSPQQEIIAEPEQLQQIKYIDAEPQYQVFESVKSPMYYSLVDVDQPVPQAQVQRLKKQKHKHRKRFKQVQLQQQLQQQQQHQQEIPSELPKYILFDQQIVEPYRVVPTYRQATPSSTRSALLEKVNLRSGREGDEEKRPVVGTTRNYSRINDDGSFTFGYESEDGSFKEETRGIDCVVRGKYGYVDPDGVKREFSYVSGNPCDKDDKEEDELQELEQDDEDEESIPRVRAGIRQRIPKQQISPENIQGLEQTVEEKLSEEQLPALFRISPRRRPDSTLRLAQQQQNVQVTTFRPRPRVRVTTEKPTSPPPAAIPQLQDPDNYFQRQYFPHQLQFPHNSNHQQFLAQHPQFDFFGNLNALTSPTAASSQGVEEPSQALDVQTRSRGEPLNNLNGFNFEQELAQIQEYPIQFTQQPQNAQTQSQNPFFQIYTATPANSKPTPAPAPKLTPKPRALPLQASQIQAKDQADKVQKEIEDGTLPNFLRYRTELVFDPNTNQYTSVLVQDLPGTAGAKGNEEQIMLTQRLQAYVDPSRPDQFQYHRAETPQIQYYNPNFHHQQSHFPQYYQQFGQQPQQQQLTQAGQQQQQQQIQQQQQQNPSFYLQQFGPHSGNFHFQHPLELSPTAASSPSVSVTPAPNQNNNSPSQISANSQSTGQIDAFLRSLNIDTN